MVPNHYPNQRWNIANWTLGNKLPWNLNENSNIFIQENAFENVVWKMSAILSRAQCVKTCGPWSPTPSMGLLPDTQNRGLRMHWECRERFPCHRFQRKMLVSDPGMDHGTCVTHVPWCMSGSLTCGGGENVPGIPGACATRNFTYLARDPWCRWSD